MERRTIEELMRDKNQNINYKDLRSFFNNKLDELYKKDKEIPLFDYDEIKYAAVIDFIYELVPSLRDEMKFGEE